MANHANLPSLKTCWIVARIYLDGSFDEDGVDELDELRGLVEGGPDWHLISRIEIRLNRHAPIGSQIAELAA